LDDVKSEIHISGLLGISFPNSDSCCIGKIILSDSYPKTILTGGFIVVTGDSEYKIRLTDSDDKSLPIDNFELTIRGMVKPVEKWLGWF
jgi:hypothetical protein